jgi:hypothetical protein
MKALTRTFGNILIFSIWTAISMTSPLFGQDSKNKVRLSVSYTGIMPNESFLTITGRYRGEEGFEPASSLEYEISKILGEDSLVIVGRTKSDAAGQAIFKLAGLSPRDADSTGVYQYRVSSLEHPDYQEVERSIAFKKARLEASVDSEEDVNSLSARLVDTSTGEPITELPLKVQVERLFRPMRIGEEFYMTDEDGAISVAVPPGIPGLDGNLTLEVVLSDNDDYGTVKALIEAPIGTPVEDQSTFDERTMWSPPSKTPLFLLIFPNLIIIGIWGTILYLILNLYKIYRSKN